MNGCRVERREGRGGRRRIKHLHVFIRRPRRSPTPTPPESREEVRGPKESKVKKRDVGNPNSKGGVEVKKGLRTPINELTLGEGEKDLLPVLKTSSVKLLFVKYSGTIFTYLLPRRPK